MIYEAECSLRSNCVFFLSFLSQAKEEVLHGPPSVAPILLSSFLSSFGHICKSSAMVDYAGYWTGVITGEARPRRNVTRAALYSPGAPCRPLPSPTQIRSKISPPAAGTRPYRGGAQCHTGPASASNARRTKFGGSRGGRFGVLSGHDQASARLRAWEGKLSRRRRLAGRPQLARGHAAAATHTRTTYHTDTHKQTYTGRMSTYLSPFPLPLLSLLPRLLSRYNSIHSYILQLKYLIFLVKQLFSTFSPPQNPPCGFLSSSLTSIFPTKSSRFRGTVCFFIIFFFRFFLPKQRTSLFSSLLQRTRLSPHRLLRRLRAADAHYVLKPFPIWTSARLAKEPLRKIGCYY